MSDKILRAATARFAFGDYLGKMDDKDYFYRRAEAELEMAQQTEVPQAVQAHYTMASLYLDKVYGDDAEGDGENESAPEPAAL